MAQTALFQIVPNSTNILVDKLAKATVTQTGGTYNKAGYTAMDGSGGVYVKDMGMSLMDGVQIEAVISLPLIPNLDGGLVVKNKTLCLGFSANKFKTNWINGAADAYNASADQINGLRQLTPGKHTLRWSYDAVTGMVVMTVDGMQDRKRYRFAGPGEISTDGTSSWQFLKNVKVNIYSLTVWSGKPNLVAAGMECYATEGLLNFRHVDPALVGAVVNRTLENPYGATKDLLPLTVPVGGDFIAPLVIEDVPGIYTLYMTAVKGGKVVWSQQKLVLNRVKPVLPTAMVKGIYHVNKANFAQVKALGATHIMCDYTMNSTPGGWQQHPDYLAAAAANGLELVVAANFAAKTGTFAFGKDLAAAWYAADEAQGNFERLRASYLASRMEYPNTPVIMNLNNFTRLEDAAECCDILMVNVYLPPAGDLQKITDVVRKAAELRPTWLVLPLYEAMQTPEANLLAMAKAGKDANAAGIWIFEFDHRSAAQPDDWYMGDMPGIWMRVKAVFDSLG